MRLSVCIITKNEWEHLEKCLLALRGYDLEIVVVDTGSEDDTLTGVYRYTDAVYRFSWCDDFAKAKNHAVSKAAHDRVLVLDSDEYVTEFDPEKLQRQIDQCPQGLGRICRKNATYVGDEIRWNREYINRLFDRRYYHYEGCVHEQLVRNEPEQGDPPVYLTGITVEHSGYLLTSEQKLQKARRNRELLLRMYEEHPGDSYILYQLGKSCYMAEDYAGACEYFRRALEQDLDEHLEYVIDMVQTYGYALVNAGRAGEALGFEGLAETFGGSSDFWFLMGVIYMNNEVYDLSLKAYERARELGNARTEGADSYLADYNMGVICECLGRNEEALRHYERAGEYAPAARRHRLLLTGVS